MQFMYQHFSGLVYWHLRGTSGIPTEYIATTKYNRVHNSQDAKRLRKKYITLQNGGNVTQFIIDIKAQKIGLMFCRNIKEAHMCRGTGSWII